MQCLNWPFERRSKMDSILFLPKTRGFPEETASIARNVHIYWDQLDEWLIEEMLNLRELLRCQGLCLTVLNAETVYFHQ